MFKITGYYEKGYEIVAYQVMDIDSYKLTKLKSSSVEDLVISGLVANAKVVNTDSGRLIVIDNMEEIKRLKGSGYKATRILKKNGEIAGVEIHNIKNGKILNITINRAWELIRDGDIENASVGMRNGKKIIIIDAE